MATRLGATLGLSVARSQAAGESLSFRGRLELRPPRVEQRHRAGNRRQYRASLGFGQLVLSGIFPRPAPRSAISETRHDKGNQLAALGARLRFTGDYVRSGGVVFRFPSQSRL
ncbi:hypothetical protein D3C86_1840410 [compost metagenome]